MSNQRLFEVGDKVRSPLWKGVAIVVENRHKEGSHIITIKDPTSSGIYHSFYSNGLRYGEYEHSLRHAETGSPCRVGEPPERIEYPVYVTNDCYIVEFTSLTFGTVMANDNGIWRIGYSTNEWTAHTNRDIWTPCEKPKWKPTKPTWCWVWDGAEERSLHLVIRWCEAPLRCSSEAGYNYVTYRPDSHRMVFRHAMPCEDKDIPDYWPEAWV